MYALKQLLPSFKLLGSNFKDEYKLKHKVQFSLSK